MKSTHAFQGAGDRDSASCGIGGGRDLSTLAQLSPHCGTVRKPQIGDMFVFFQVAVFRASYSGGEKCSKCQRAVFLWDGAASEMPRSS